MHTQTRTHSNLIFLLASIAIGINAFEEVPYASSRGNAGSAIPQARPVKPIVSISAPIRQESMPDPIVRSEPAPALLPPAPTIYEPPSIYVMDVPPPHPSQPKPPAVAVPAPMIKAAVTNRFQTANSGRQGHWSQAANGGIAQSGTRPVPPIMANPNWQPHHLSSWHPSLGSTPFDFVLNAVLLPVRVVTSPINRTLQKAAYHSSSGGATPSYVPYKNYTQGNNHAANQNPYSAPRHVSAPAPPPQGAKHH